MKFLIKVTFLVILFALVVEAVGLIADRQTLQDNLVRLHVVAQSDSDFDQGVKLQVRDAVLAFLEEHLQKVADIESAKAIVQENLQEIQQVANDTLTQLGVAQSAAVSFLKEKFPVREYDSFTLPSGVYESLRITIGDGQGRNWWCVVFPKLCTSATSVKDTAVGSGFSETLSNTITNQDGYQVRFFFLDVLGKLENLFYKN